MTLLIHEGKYAEDLLLKNGTIPDPGSTDNDVFKIFQTILKCQLEGGETDKGKNFQCVYGIFWGDLNRSSPPIH